MKPLLTFCAALAICLMRTQFCRSQSSTQPASSLASNASFEKGLFETDSILDITLSGEIRGLLHDRTSKAPTYFPLALEYKSGDGGTISIPIEAKTRGHFRRLPENCQYPPILLHFLNSDALKSSIFNDCVKLKLVMPCRGDQYTIHEWLAYKIYNLITPYSFRARLVRVTLQNAGAKKPAAPFIGLLLEEEQHLAKRNGFIEVTRKLRPEQTDVHSFQTMAVFEYMIGNTDWSIQYMQNIKLLAADSVGVPIAVPYDFDMSGLVNTPYAKPAEELELNSVRTRRYRGYCLKDLSRFDSTIVLFNGLKKDIYAIVRSCVLLDEKYIISTIKFLDEFYATINNPVAMKKEFSYPCDKNGTGNVVIKGLRDD
ncbi:MAG TPA: hypothetical protein VKR32_09315 [Puia sp.]|nr:hypothetical protein [Puia sp.]